jgi:hypothetical protein
MLLTRRQILVVHDAATRVGLASQRAALLSGVDVRVTDGITRASNDAAQMLLDLTALDAIARREGEVPPLAVWLDNAVAFSSARPEVAIFRDAARVVSGGAPALSVEAGLASIWSTEGALLELLGVLGIAAEELPAGGGVAARIHYLLLYLAERRDARRLATLAAAVERRAPAESLLAGQIRQLSASAQGDEWPDGMEEAWLNVRRAGGGFRIDYRFPGLGLSGSMELDRPVSRRLSPDVAIAAEPGRSGLLVQILGGPGSPLVGATARVWAGVHSVSKMLRPWSDDRLGESAGVLLSTFIEVED